MKFVALLRGIMPMNPNMRNEKLRGVLEELEAMLEADPFKGMDDSPTARLNVTFLKDRTGTGFQFPYEGSGYRVLGERDGAIFSVVDLSGASSPDVMMWLERQFGKNITTRTWKTVHRILQKFG